MQNAIYTTYQQVLKFGYLKLKKCSWRSKTKIMSKEYNISKLRISELD